MTIPCNISHQYNHHHHYDQQTSHSSSLSSPSPSMLSLFNVNSTFLFHHASALSSLFTSKNVQSSLIPLTSASGPGTSPSDIANLILWYHGDDISGSPIYTVDGRGDNIYMMLKSHQHRHFVSTKLTNRTSVDLYSRPARLIIDSVDLEDSGTYWCRADFRWTRTLISMVELNVQGKVLYLLIIFIIIIMIIYCYNTKVAKLRLASPMLIHFKLDYQGAWPPLL